MRCLTRQGGLDARRRAPVVRSEPGAPLLLGAGELGRGEEVRQAVLADAGQLDGGVAAPAGVRIVFGPAPRMNGVLDSMISGAPPLPENVSSRSTEGAVMRKTLAMSETYRSVITRMNRTDGTVAIGVYVALLALYTGHGKLMQSGILQTRAAFEALNFAVAIIGLTVVAVVLRSRRQNLASVGLRREGLRRSLMLGLAAAGVLSAANVGLAYWQGARHLNILEAAQMTALLAFFAAEEELIFRGYLTARLHGLISRPRVAQLLGVLLFVSIHLPNKLIPSPAQYLTTFELSDALWLANLLLVGYVYDTLYRATGSIAGCAAAHCLVNLSYSLLV